MAGVVGEIGPNVSAFRPGDEVYGMIGGIGGLQGALGRIRRGQRRVARRETEVAFDA
jgi:NADPH:quinone reductase-like Zn-dependent oxidoreductase